MKILAYLTCILAILSACQTSPQFEKSASTMESLEEFDQEQERQADPEDASTSLPRKMIKTGDLNFTVHNLDSAHKRILEIIDKEKAFVSNEALETYQGHRAYRLTVRVNPERLEPLISQVLDGSESLTHKRIETQDVSQRYYDLESRLATKKALEQRYLQLLSKANVVEDILKIESEAAQLREDIEAMEGSFRLLKNQIGLSTLNLYFYESEAASAPGILSRIGENFQNGWTGFVNALVGIINVWPLILLLLAGFWGFRKYRQKRRNT